MHKNRIEAFSDGVIAIIITVMVLEFKTPQSDSLQSLLPLASSFLSYVISFIYVGIYWNNHHHLFQAVERVRGPTLWANLHLLFWLSLVPFTTNWMGANRFSQWPVVFYGINLLMSGVAYYILVQTLLRDHDKDSHLAVAVGKDAKGILSVVFYVIGIVLAFYNSWFSYGIFLAVALMWLVPDRRIESVLIHENKEK